MAVPETLVNVQPFSCSLTLSPSSQHTRWPQKAAEMGVAQLGGGLALPQSWKWGVGAGSEGNLMKFFT